jgi:hypothetical protein
VAPEETKSAPSTAHSFRPSSSRARVAFVTAELNDTFYPILLSRIDEPVTLGEIENYFKKLVRLADDGLRKRERYVVIVVSDVVKFSAAGRRQVGEVQARYLTPQRNEVTLAAFVPVDNAFVRGIVTAVRWFAPDLVKSIELVSSLEVALDKALSALESNGTPFKGDRSALRRAMGLRS